MCILFLPMYISQFVTAELCYEWGLYPLLYYCLLFAWNNINYYSLYGSEVNVTALPFMPFWGEVKGQAPDGTTVTRYEGSDYQMLMAVASALNFTIRVLHSTSWAQVSSLRHR